MVEREFLTLAVWDRLDAVVCEHVGRAVADALADGWRFDRVEWAECGDQRRHVAVFVHGGAEFVLVPGGPATLGYDRTTPFVPTPALRESWRGTMEEYDLPDMAEHLSEVTTSLRTVDFAPLLVERKAQPPDKFGGRDEFRLPSPDEWEHLCRAGSRTLWRWGDDCPTDRYPGLRSTDGPEHLPTAFGLSVSASPYDCELCENGEWRGGDGGVSICGGAGFLAGWLPLMPAYRMTEETYADWDTDNLLARRVVPLPADLLG